MLKLPKQTINPVIFLIWIAVQNRLTMNSPSPILQVLKFATSWLTENVKRIKLFSHGNNVSDDLSYPKYLRLFHYLLRDDLKWMMVVTVYHFRNRFLTSFIVSSYCHKSSWHGKWICVERLKQRCEMISIGSYDIHLDVCGAVTWS